MARTRNPETHSVKRDVFVDATQRLIQATGYDALSIQDVIDEVGVSKGAFYHYFGSKADLLEAVVQHIADGVMEALTPVTTDPALPALARLQGIFAEGGRWKSDRKELMVALLRPWYSDANVLVRERVARTMTARLVPRMAAVVRQGREEGTFTVSSPDHAAGILMSLLIGSGDTTSKLFLDRLAGVIPFEDVCQAVAAYDEAIERILGLPAGSFRLMDDLTLRFWFG